MSTPQSKRESHADFILRRVDGASRPILVEEIYADYDANVRNWSSTRGHRMQLLNAWPRPGDAWDEFQEDILSLIDMGSVVMGTNTDPADHPEHHLTEGHEDHRPFTYGPTPMVLRYLATPAGSVAWRTELAERRKAAEATAVQEAKVQESLREAVYALTTIKPYTEKAAAGRLSMPLTSTRRAFLELAKAGRITTSGKTILGATRWTAVQPSEPATNGE